MGDTTAGAQPVGSNSNTAQNTTLPVSSLSLSGIYDNAPRKMTAAPSPQSNVPMAGHHPYQQYHPQFHNVQPRADTLNMSSLEGALPDMSYQNYGHVPLQRYSQDHPQSGLVYPMQGHPQYAAQTASRAPSSNSPYHMQYQSQYHGMYPSSHAPQAQQMQSGAPTGNQFYQGLVMAQHHHQQHHQQAGPPYYMQPAPFGPQGQGYPNQLAPSFGARSSFHGDFHGENVAVSPRPRSNEYAVAAPGSAVAGAASSVGKSPR